MLTRRTKVYFSTTLEAALAQARRELGPEALLVDAGPAPGRDGKTGGYRVVCELDQTPDGQAPTTPAPAQENGLPLRWEDLLGRLGRLENLLEAVAGGMGGIDHFPGAAALQTELVALDFPPGLARRLVIASRERMAAGGEAGDRPASLRACLLEELSTRIAFAGALGEGHRPAVVALAGPPGSGKTSTLVKLAMREGLARRRSAAIVSTDSHRVAASEQLRTYAAILGLPFALAETPAMLRQAVAEHANRDLVLIDTPGFSRAEADWAEEWARLLSAAPDLETHLVLPATWRARDLAATVAWWVRFKPCGLLFTRLDETGSCGGWVAAAIESGLPVSFFSTGQTIPEDLEPASLSRVEAALAPELARTAAAGGRP